MAGPFSGAGAIFVGPEEIGADGEAAVDCGETVVAFGGARPLIHAVPGGTVTGSSASTVCVVADTDVEATALVTAGVCVGVTSSDSVLGGMRPAGFTSSLVSRELGGSDFRGSSTERPLRCCVKAARLDVDRCPCRSEIGELGSARLFGGLFARCLASSRSFRSASFPRNQSIGPAFLSPSLPSLQTCAELEVSLGSTLRLLRPPFEETELMLCSAPETEPRLVSLTDLDASFLWEMRQCRFFSFSAFSAAAASSPCSASELPPETVECERMDALGDMLG